MNTIKKILKYIGWSLLSSAVALLVLVIVAFVQVEKFNNNLKTTCHLIVEDYTSPEYTLKTMDGDIALKTITKKGNYICDGGEILHEKSIVNDLNDTEVDGDE